MRRRQCDKPKDVLWRKCGYFLTSLRTYTTQIITTVYHAAGYETLQITFAAAFNNDIQYSVMTVCFYRNVTEYCLYYLYVIGVVHLVGVVNEYRVPKCKK